MYIHAIHSWCLFEKIKNKFFLPGELQICKFTLLKK